MLLYHGTTKSRIENIKKLGLTPADYEVFVEMWASSAWCESFWPVEKYFDFHADHVDFGDDENRIHTVLKSHQEMIGKTSLSSVKMVAESYAIDASKTGYGVVEQKIIDVLPSSCPLFKHTDKDEEGPVVVVCEVPIETKETVVLLDKVEPEQIVEFINLESRDAVEG